MHQTNVVLMDVFVADRRGDQMPVRSEHKAAQLSHDGQMAQTFRNEDVLEGLLHTGSNSGNVRWLLAGKIRHADSAREVHKGKPCSRFGLEIADDLEEHFR